LKTEGTPVEPAFLTNFQSLQTAATEYNQRHNLPRQRAI
jgi:hypothetical protein